MQLIVQDNVEIKHNMELIKNEVIEQIKQYDIVVTLDTLKNTKSLMADINKQKTEFSNKCKQVLKVIEKPIKEFKDYKKEIENLYVDARNVLSIQVDKFEIVRKKEIRQILVDYKNQECNAININSDTIIIDDLVKLTSVSNKNTISKATKDVISSRIAIIQGEIAQRKLEEAERKARDENLKQQAIEQERIRAEQRIAEAKQQAIIDAKKELERELEEQKQLEEKAKQKQLENDKIEHTITVNFKVVTPQNIPANAIKSKVKDKLISLGLKDFEVL